MNKLFFASMLALFLLAPAAQSQANAFAIGDADPAIADGGWTRVARASQTGTERHGVEPVGASAGLRISDALDVTVGRVGLSVFMLAGHHGTGDAGTMQRLPAGQSAPAPWTGAACPHLGLGRTGAAPRQVLGTVKAPVAGGWHVRHDGLALHTGIGSGPFTLRIGPVRANTISDELASLNDLIGTSRAAGRDYRLPRIGDLAGDIDVHGM